MNALRRSSAALKRGFTLIELLAVILIVSILVAALTPMVNDAIESAKTRACAANLGEIYKGMTIYRTKFGEAPNESGVKFFAQLISREAIENTETNAKKLTCPSVETNALGIAGMPPEEWFSDIEIVDGSYSAYAGRNCKEFPIRSWPPSGKEPLIADDNDPEMNHRTTTNVLYGDGSVRTFELAILKEEGVLAKEETLLPVGETSPVEDLRKLTLR